MRENTKKHRREKSNINFKPFSAIFFVLIVIMLTGFSSAVSNQDLISWHSFDDGSGSTVINNVSGTGTNLTITNSDYSWVSGKIGGAVQINGVSGGVVRLNFTDLTDYQIGNQDFTLNYWFRADNTGAPSTNPEWMCIYNGVNCSGGLNFIQNIGTSNRFRWGVNTFPTNYQNNQQWQMGTIIKNGTYCTVYLNGTLSFTEDCTSLGYGVFNPITHMAFGNQLGSSADNGIQGFDEVGFWMRELSSSDISDLWNGGAGITFEDLELLLGLDVTLLEPENNSLTGADYILFNSSVEPSNGNITNATISVWFDNGTLMQTLTNTTIAGLNVTAYPTFNLTNFDTDNYYWNVYACVDNSTGFVNCDNATSNFTFSWVPFEISVQTFKTQVFETETQEFFINLTTLPTILSVTGILNYNGTQYTSTSSCTSGVCEIETAIDTPLVTTGEFENKSFYWSISVFDGINSFTTNLDPNEQNVTRIHLERCDATYTEQSLNFTAFDEANLTRINSFDFEANFEYWKGTGTVKRTTNLTLSGVNSVQMCILPTNDEFFLDGTIDYDESGTDNYTKRNYYFQNNSANNNSQLIELGLLLASDSTSFILKVQDTNILPVEDALIYTQRYYPGLGSYKTVQVSQTDSNGNTVVFLNDETVEYRFIIKKNNQTLLVTNKQKVIGESVPFTLTFTVGEDTGASWQEYEDMPDLTKSITYNKTTGIVTFTYIDTSGNFDSGLLRIYKLESSEFTDTLVCSSSSVQSSATITCNLSSNETGAYVARGYITRDGVTSLVSQELFNLEDISSVLGNLGLFLGVILIIIASFIFKFNEIAGIIMVNLAVIFVNLIGFINFGYVFITAMVAISIIILGVLKR